MKINFRLGAWLATLAAIIGIVGHFAIFNQWYEIGMAAEAAEPGCEILLRYIQPAIFDLGILGAAFFAVSAYGFFTTRKWAFPLSVIGIVLALQGSWFINVPYMAAGLPPVYFTLFWPYLVLYALFLLVVGRVSWRLTLIGMIAGMTYVFCLMNGVASLSRIITIGAPIFFAVQRLHWLAMAGWGVVTVGILLGPKEWMRVLALVSGALELTVGIPLAFVTALELGRFSLFSLAPIFSLVMVVLFVWPGFWSWLGSQAESQVAPSPSAQTIQTA